MKFRENPTFIIYNRGLQPIKRVVVLTNREELLLPMSPCPRPAALLFFFKPRTNGSPLFRHWGRVPFTIYGDTRKSLGAASSPITAPQTCDEEIATSTFIDRNPICRIKSQTVPVMSSMGHYLQYCCEPCVAFSTQQLPLSVRPSKPSTTNEIMDRTS